MNLSVRRKIEEVAELCAIPTEQILIFIQQEWIEPADLELLLLDDEDVARIHLIHELKKDFNANDEVIPLILHLVDQLNLWKLRSQE